MAIDDGMLALARDKLYSAVISDTLDSFGFLDQATPTNIRPLDDSLVICGRARTGLYMPIYHDDDTVNVYEHEIELVDDLKPGDIAVFSCGGNLRIAPWGELLSTTSRARGAVGCVTDGLVRDVRMIREMKFPVFAGGLGPLDSKHRGKMMMTDVPAMIGNVRIEPGDIVFGDADGVVSIPQAVARDVLDKALEKVESEDVMRAELEAGALLKDMFEKYGIL